MNIPPLDQIALYIHFEHFHLKLNHWPKTISNFVMITFIENIDPRATG